MQIEYRLGEEIDDRATYQVFIEANRELNKRRGLPDPYPDDPPSRFMALRRYAREYHSEGYWVAHDRDHMVGFGIGIRHPGSWYLAALQVRPHYQGSGIGRCLMERTLGISHGADVVSAISVGMQPVSNAIYIGAGMLPWAPMFAWETPLETKIPDFSVHSRMSLNPTVGIDIVSAIDQQVLGMDRMSQLKFWIEQPDIECLVMSINDEPAGYVFVSSSGIIGPAAVLSEPDSETLLIATTKRIRDMGIDHVSIKIAGLSPSTYKVVRQLGLKITGTALIVLSSRPLWNIGCYIPSSGDALY